MEKKLKKSELIGKNIEITHSKNKANIGLRGKIIDETKNMVKIKTRNGETKMLIKNNITFRIEGNEAEIRGEEIQLPPEDRIKIR
jgi:ribonuclease P protein subunit POP4